MNKYISIFLKRFYSFLREGKGGRKRERNINVWLPLMRPLPGTWPATQARAPTRNRTGDPLVCRLALNPLSHTSQGLWFTVFVYCLVSASFYSGTTICIEISSMRVGIFVKNSAWQRVSAPPNL